MDAKDNGRDKKRKKMKEKENSKTTLGLDIDH